MPVVVKGKKIVERDTGKVAGKSKDHATAVKAAQIRNMHHAVKVGKLDKLPPASKGKGGNTDFTKTKTTLPDPDSSRAGNTEFVLAKGVMRGEEGLPTLDEQKESGFARGGLHDDLKGEEEGTFEPDRYVAIPGTDTSQVREIPIKIGNKLDPQFE